MGLRFAGSVCLGVSSFAFRFVGLVGVCVWVSGVVIGVFWGSARLTG